MFKSNLSGGCFTIVGINYIIYKETSTVLFISKSASHSLQLTKKNIHRGLLSRNFFKISEDGYFLKHLWTLAGIKKTVKCSNHEHPEYVESGVDEFSRNQKPNPATSKR